MSFEWEDFWKKAGKKVYWTKNRAEEVKKFASFYYPGWQSIYHLNYGFSIHTRLNGDYVANTFSKWGQHTISHNVWSYGVTRKSDDPRSKDMIKYLIEKKVLEDDIMNESK